MTRRPATRSLFLDRKKIRTVKDFYALAIRQKHMAHLLVLRDLARGLSCAVEFGVRRGASSSALLMGAAQVIGVDIIENPVAKRLQELAGWRLDYRIASSLDVTIPPCDLLFLDSAHTFAQVDGELRRHADQVRSIVAFHDTTRNGLVGDDGGPGIRAAIDAWLARDPRWTVRREYSTPPGLLIVGRAA